MKQILKMFIIIQLLLMISLSVYASEGYKQVTKKMNENSLKMASERNDVIQAFNNSVEQFTRFVDLDYKFSKNKIKFDKSITLEKIENSFKIYELEYTDIINKYKRGYSLEDIISNDYFWVVPIYDLNMNIIYISSFELGKSYDDIIKSGIEISVEDKEEVIKTLKEKEGKWNWSMFNNMIPNNLVELLVDEYRIAEKLTENDIYDPEIIKVIPLPGFYSFMLYVKDNNMEYGMPLSLREDKINVTNGNLYKISELFNILEKNLDDISHGGEIDEFGNVKIGNGSALISNSSVDNGDNNETNQFQNSFLLYSSLIMLLMTIIIGVYYRLKPRNPRLF